MPEGDTIHNTARRLRAALAGRRVVRFELRRDPHGVRVPQPGTTVTEIEARGKHLLMTFDDGATLHTHMQLTGRWDVYAPAQRWRRPGHRARVVLEVDDGTTAVCFDAPVVELERAQRPRPPTRARRSLERLGPDLCTPGADVDTAIANLARCDPASTIAEVLLDQRVASGIGNVFKSEICWACRVDPRAPLRTLDDDTRRALYDTAHRFLLANVGARRRTTLGNGLAAYGRAGRPCPRCRTPITREQLGATPRATFWCPRCQGNTTSA